MSGPTYLNPPRVAEMLGVDCAKVLRWIHRGELPAVNVAESLGGRPRWRISRDALGAFLAARSNRESVKPIRRRRLAAPVREWV